MTEETDSHKGSDDSGQFLDVSIGLPLDYQNEKGSRKSHFPLTRRWDYKTRRLCQLSQPTLRLQAGEQVSMETGPWPQIDSALDPLWMRREAYSDLGCRIVIELDDLNVAARQEHGLSQDDRDKAIYLLLCMLVSITKGEKMPGNTLEVKIDADAYKMWKQGNPRSPGGSSFHNSAESGQYARLSEDESRVSMKIKLTEGQLLQSAWGWNANTKALRPMDSPQANLIVEGKTDTNPENMIVVEACRRLDPNFLLRYESTMNYKGSYDISSLEKLYREIARKIPTDSVSDIELEEIPDLLGRTAYNLLFGDPKSNKPIPLKKTDRLLFVPIQNFGQNISIQPMHSVCKFFGHDPMVEKL